MGDLITMDAHFKAWSDASEERRAASHAILLGEEKSPAFAGEGKARTISEQSRRAGVSRQLLYRAIRAGALKTFVPYRGGNQRITDGEMAQWMVSRRTAA